MQNYPIAIEDYYTPEQWQRFKTFADGKETPFVVIDNAMIKQAYKDLETNFPYADIFYAIKANPGVEILQGLADLGSNFDVASIYELDKVLSLGVSPERCSYGNTIKKKKDIAYFYEKGVRLFATDSEADLANIAEVAPGSKVYVRVLTEGALTADWPLSRKFGCQVELATQLIQQCADLGLEPYGLSFHVGSQQRDVSAWHAAITKMKFIFDHAQSEFGITLKMLNLGGGFPANYLTRSHELEVYATEITRFLEEEFSGNVPRIILEPGRSIASNAGILVSEVVLISRKHPVALQRWVFTDVGKFSGLIETLDECIKYPIHVEKKGELEEVVIAGPTCDSADIMYENNKYSLPLDLEIGERMYWFSAGAYTTSYSAIEFNGFPPLKQYVFE